MTGLEKVPRSPLEAHLVRFRANHAKVALLFKLCGRAITEEVKVLHGRVLVF